MLSLQQGARSFAGPRGAVHAVQDLSLELAAGDFLALCGPSGSGKSTALLMAGGLLAPTGGRVLVDGQDCYALSPAARARLRARQIGFVFQRFHLTPYLTLLENIRSPALGGAVADDVQRARELGQRFGIGERLDHKPQDCSAGEQQRCALARALFPKPGLLLADEPTGNLDSGNATVVLDALEAFAEAGGAVLLITHDERAAARAQRRVDLADGRVVTAGAGSREDA